MYFFASKHKSRYFLPALLLTNAGLFVLIFFADYNWKHSGNQGKVIGRVVYIENLVQRKGGRDLLWSDVYLNSLLRNKDIVRAGRLSGAQFSMRDGTQIKIEEGSMFRLDLSENQAKLNFKRGSIRIDQRGQNPRNFIIQAGSQKVELKKSNAKIEALGSSTKDKSAVRLDIFVERGEAKLSNRQDKTRKEYIVRAQERAHVTNSQARIQKVMIQLRSPSDQSLFYKQAKGKKPIAFSWQAQGKYQKKILEISSSRYFDAILRSVAIKRNTARLFLDSGNYFWRIRAFSSAKKWITSLHYSFQILQNSKLRLLYPANGQRFAYMSQAPKIGFSWSSIARAAYYQLELSSRPNLLTKKIYKLQLREHSLTLPPGRYYWRISAYFSLPEMRPVRSGIASFRIRKLSASARPLLEQPQHKQKISLHGRDQESKGILFSWEAIPECKSFHFQLSKDPSFKKILAQRKLRQHYFHLGKIDKKLQAGSYYWRVQGIISSGKVMAFSRIRQFFILPKQGAAKKLRRPAQQILPAPRSQSIREASLQEYRSYLQSLSYKCKKGLIPDMLIKECYATSIVLHLAGWERLHMYYFLKMQDSNLENRRIAYNYFREHCNFRPARELADTHAQNLQDASLVKKEHVYKLLHAFRNCSKK